MAKEGFFSGVYDTELFYRFIVPKSTPKAAVILVHGHGDHSGGLSNLSESLAENGYAACAFDLRGHGKSEGTRGFIRSWSEFIGDLDRFRKMVVSEFPNLPIYIAGHSLGGIIGIDYCLTSGKGIAGLIAISPAISYELPFLERVLIKITSRIRPDYTLAKKMGNLQLLVQDPVMISKISMDTLRHNTVTPGLGRGILEAIPRLMKQASSLKVPFLLQFGLEDKVTPPEKIRTFFDRVGSQDKRKIEYPSLRHRPFDDIGREHVLDDVISWLEQHPSKMKQSAII